MQSKQLSKAVPRADSMIAKEFAKKILGQFTQSPHDPVTMLLCLTRILENQSIETLKAMADPVTGIAGREPFFSLSGARDWLDHYTPPAPPRIKPERFPAKEENISDEERERRAKMLKNVANVIRETVRAKCVGRPTLQWKQVDDAKARIKALGSALHCGAENE